MVSTLEGTTQARAFKTNFTSSSRHDIRDATRVLVMDQGFAILDSLEDEIPGLEGGLLGQAGGSALATVPNALVRSAAKFN